MRKIVFLTISFLILFTNKNFSQCWNLVWSDEFNGTSLDLSKWSYQVGAGGWGNNELQYYTDRVDNTQVSGGTLKIIAKQESYNGSNYTSARLRTLNKGDWKYGRMEMFAKLPETQGLWPAFWLLPSENVYGIWPNSGEIDIMELLGHQPNKTYGTIHTQGAIPGQSASTSSNYVLPTGTFASSFHLLAVEWEPTAIRWYVDNTLFATKTPADLTPWRFTELFHIILNVAVGGNWPGAPNGSTVFPQTMEVDYVRVYQKLNDLRMIGVTQVEPLATSSYDVPAIAGATYLWSASNGASITSGQNTPNAQVTFAFPNTVVSCQVTTSCGTHTVDKNVIVEANMLKNPSFESDFANWSTATNGGASASFSIDTNTPQHLLKDACVQTITPLANPWNVQLRQGNLALLAGQNYTLKFWAKADVAGKKISAAVLNSSTYAQLFFSNVTLTDQWQQYAFTFTPSVAATAQLNLDCAHAVGTFCFDNVFLAKTNLVLPIELISFDAKYITENDAQLRWRFAKNDDLATLEIESSNDGLNFNTLEKIAQKRLFDNLIIKNYAEKGLFYRLKMIEKDGAITYSKIVSLKKQQKKAIKIYPNPSTQILYFDGIAAMDFHLQIINEAGQMVLQKTAISNNSIDISSLPAGFYQVLIRNESSEVIFQEKLVIN